MNTRTEITVNGKPSQTQLNDWYENGIAISLEANGNRHNGKIKSYKPMGNGTLLWIENSPFGVYLRDITSYVFIPEIEPIFIDAKSDSPEKVGLMAEGRTFWVNKEIISQRLEFFRAMFQNGMEESRKNTIDLSQLISFQELKVLLLVVSAGNCEVLTLEQAQIFLEAAPKVSEFKMIEQAQARINDCIAIINEDFLLAVLARDYATCTEMLTKGANINEKFGKYSQTQMWPFCKPKPNDTPLTYAVKREDEVLTKFLLNNGAKTEVLNPEVLNPLEVVLNPLAEACLNHNPKIVKLLLQAGADPNANGGFAMHNMFLVMKFWLLDKQEKTATEIMKLLLDKGYTAKPADIAKMLKERGCSEVVINLFHKIWENQKSSAGKLPHEKERGIINFFYRFWFWKNQRSSEAEAGNLRSNPPPEPQ